MKIFGIQIGNKTSLELAIDEAILLLNEQRYNEAAQIIKTKALSQNPKDRRALLHLGVCRMMQERLDEAEAILRPLTNQKQMDSEKAAAQIALEKVKKLRKEKGAQS